MRATHISIGLLIATAVLSGADVLMPNDDAGTTLALRQVTGNPSITIGEYRRQARQEEDDLCETVAGHIRYGYEFGGADAYILVDCNLTPGQCPDLWQHNPHIEWARGVIDPHGGRCGA